MTRITLPYATFLEISGIDFDDIVEVSVSLGVADFAKRDIENSGFAVFLSLKDSNGKFRGNGAYAGAVTAFDQETLNQLWAAAGEKLSEDELYLSAGANEGNYLDEDGQAICSDCLSASGEFNEDTSPENPKKNCACWSCSTMIDENINDQARMQEESSVMAEWEAIQAREWAGVS
jgi:hypothetical protein